MAFSFPSCPHGYKRHWFRCTACGQLYAVDKPGVSSWKFIIHNECDHGQGESIMPAVAFEILERDNPKTKSGKEERKRRLRRVLKAAAAIDNSMRVLSGGGIVRTCHDTDDGLRLELIRPERVVIPVELLYELQEAVRSLKAHGWKENVEEADVARAGRRR